MTTVNCESTETVNGTAVAIKVSDIMTTDLFTLYDTDNLLVLKETMDWRTIRHVPVIDDNKRLTGLVTHRDLLRASASIFEVASSTIDKSKHQQMSIAQIMVKRPRSITPNTTLKDAAVLMLKNKFGCLPIVDEQTNELVGIITEADFVKFFVEQDFFTL